MSTTPYAHRTVFISGGSRGIGLAIAKRLAADGANIALMAKTDKPHPKLAGTVHTAAQEIRDAGGNALPIVGDVRNDDDVHRAINATVEVFGGIDVVINNASAIDLRPAGELPMKQVDLMHDINTRGTYLITKSALQHLGVSEDPRILSLSPPINLAPKWLGIAPAYMMAKYGMTLATLGIGTQTGISATCLWPKTTIQTAAVQYALGGQEMYERSRTPELYADAAYQVLTAPRETYAGQAVLCEDVLADAGITDLSRYSPGVAESELTQDLFVD